MKTTFGERIIMVAVLALIALTAIQTCNWKAEKLSQTETVLQLKDDTLARVKDKAGREHVEKTVQQADIKILKALHKQEMDSVLNLLHIKDDQVQAIQFAGIQTAGGGKLKVDTVLMDSSHSNYPFMWADNWMKINGQIGDSNYVQYLNTDSLVFTTYHDKKGTKIHAYSLNPNTRFVGLTSLQLPAERPKRLSFGPYIGVTYSQGKVRPQIGVGFHYNLFNF